MSKNKNKNKSLVPVICTAAVAAAAAVLLIFGSAGGTKVIAEGGSLSIRSADIGETAKFYPISVDGTEMEVLAIRTADGDVRTAFNTCQSCFSSGNGYYKAEGNELVCQNCGFRFSADQVGIEGGGCNPFPITAENKTDDGATITIDYDFLSANKAIFGNWNRH